jgi:hypothetical protein
LATSSPARVIRLAQTRAKIWFQELKAFNPISKLETSASNGESILLGSSPLFDSSASPSAKEQKGISWLIMFRFNTYPREMVGEADGSFT